VTIPTGAATVSPSAVVLGLVMGGGAVGVLVRSALVLPVDDQVGAAWVTVAINVMGSLLLGVVVGWLDGRHPRVRAFLGTGVLGGFTTYSAFAVQTVVAGATALWFAAALVAASVAGGLLGAVLGLFIGRRIADVPGEIEPPESAE
jgi:CrcB protein